MNENKHGSRELPDPRILSSKYGQTGNVKPLTPNRSLSFVVKWPNLDLKVLPLGWSGSGSLIRDHSDHGRLNKPMNPCPEWIHRFIWSTMIRVSLHSKRFRASSSRKLGQEQKKIRNDGGGGRERRKRLPANPTILKNCVRPRTQLLIGAVLVVLIK